MSNATDRRERRANTLTEGQVRARLAQHARARHAPGVDFCDGCLMRWGGMSRLFGELLSRTRRGGL